MGEKGRVLVTGVNGFVGTHLVHELTTHGFGVIGIGLGDPAPCLSSELEDYLDHDLTESWPQVPGLTHIVHLAALSAVGPSFADPQRYLSTNSSMVVNLGEHLLSGPRGVRTLVVSSGAVYDPDQSLPIAESGAIRHGSPYVVSKVLVESLASYYVGRGLDWIVARPFNHIGPGQGPGFLLPDLYSGAVDVVRTGGPLRVGDLNTRRDYSDVRDVVGAYRQLLELARPADRLYNVCSMREASGAEILAELQRLGIGDGVEVEVDPERLRPNDPRLVVGDSTRLRAETGWEARRSLASSVEDFVKAAEAARIH